MGVDLYCNINGSEILDDLGIGLTGMIDSYNLWIKYFPIKGKIKGQGIK